MSFENISYKLVRDEVNINPSVGDWYVKIFFLKYKKEFPIFVLSKLANSSIPISFLLIVFNGYAVAIFEKVVYCPAWVVVVEAWTSF